MRRRSNLMVLLGIAFFILGLAAVYLLTNDDDDGGGGDDVAVTVVVANQTIAAGSLGEDLIEDGALREIEVPSGQRLPDAAGSLEQLRTARFVNGYAKDQQITLSGVQPLTSNIDVPEGFEAVAVQLDFVGGGAGYVTVNDRINLYAVSSTHASDKPTPRVELLFANVQILDLSLDIPARVSSQSDSTGQTPDRPGGGPITYLLALPTGEVERIVFQTTFEQLYATLVAEDAPAPGDTPGVDGSNVLSGAPSVGPAES